MTQDLEDFKTYHRAMEVVERVWKIVAKRNYFEKDTIGKQLVRAVDSVAANLSEGSGRYHFKEIKNFSAEVEYKPQSPKPQCLSPKSQSPSANA